MKGVAGKRRRQAERERGREGFASSLCSRHRGENLSTRGASLLCRAAALEGVERSVVSSDVIGQSDDVKPGQRLRYASVQRATSRSARPRAGCGPITHWPSFSPRAPSSLVDQSRGIFFPPRTRGYVATRSLNEIDRGMSRSCFRLGQVRTRELGGSYVFVYPAIRVLRVSSASPSR